MGQQSGNIEGINNKLIWQSQMEFGSLITPVLVASGVAYAAPAGTFIYAIKAKGGDLTFSAATAVNTTTPALLPLIEDDIEYFPLLSFTQTGGTAYVYLQNLKTP